MCRFRDAVTVLSVTGALLVGGAAMATADTMHSAAHDYHNASDSDIECAHDYHSILGSYTECAHDYH